MSKVNDTDRPAFPVVAHHEVYCTGMTLRDWFAGQALVGLLSGGEPGDHAAIARNAYRMADAMLAERAKDASNA